MEEKKLNTIFEEEKMDAALAEEKVDVGSKGKRHVKTNAQPENRGQEKDLRIRY